MNLENFKRVLAHIEAFPETWYQGDWHCGTQHCLAGHAQIMAGKPLKAVNAYDDAMEFLDIDHNEAEWLFFHGEVKFKDLTDIYSFHKKNPESSFISWINENKSY